MTRQQIYALLIFIAAATLLGRILAVDRVDVRELQRLRLAQVQPRLDAKEAELRQLTDNEERIQAELQKAYQNLVQNATLESPFLSGNDRSRWCTIRVLVEPDMRVVRKITNKDGSEQYRYVWYAIDKAQDVKGWDTIDMVKHELPDQPEQAYLYSSKPPLLPTVLAIPYAVLYWGSGQRLSLGHDPYFVVRIILILCNLLPLVYCWVLLVRLIERFGTTDWGRIFSAAFVCFGTFLSTFAVTLNNHLPAVFCVTISFYCGVRILFDEETRWRYFFCAGFFGFLAAACELPALSFCAALGLMLLLKYRRQTLLGYLSGTVIVAAAFFATNYIAHQTLLPAYSQRDWYFYEYERGGVLRDSYWKNPVGIDQGEPSRFNYFIHTTVGHHGLFLLTPVWILSFAGLGIWTIQPFDKRFRSLALLVLLLSLIVFTFYMLQEQPNRNYGGMTSALRWLFWFVPLWSVPLVTAADWLSRFRWSRAIALTLLAISVMSATYPTWNPWTQPWTYQLMIYLNWQVIQ
ncbi:MAG: glycosyltransferase family 39 protein [Planctomycetaceae bacterium]|jgi:hypothetical protein|nr:glycosyltransferase family 39 protein [Planctomycetaceae bacterium]